jgi:ligand-binding sensor domain-containing protein/signal transduction histidine kinase/DNA-binding response OmpR family regulator
MLTTCFHFLYSQPETYFTFKNISVKDGLAQGIINSIHQDRHGFMWFGTGNGLNRYDGYEFKSYKHKKDDSTSLSNNLIHCMVEDSLGCLWIGTADGLNCYDSRTESFKRYRHIPEDPQSLSNNYVKSLFLDKEGNLWIGTDMFLNRLDGRTGRFHHYSFDDRISNSRIFDIHKDVYGEMWLATRNSGLIRFNPETFQYEQYLPDKEDRHSISSEHVYTIFEDSESQLWIGTWEHGVNQYDRERNCFNRMSVNKDGTGLSNNQIRCISENGDGSLWIGTFEGLNIYNPKNKTFSYCLRHNNVPGTLSYNTINYLYHDKAGTIWLGTHGGGVDLYNPVFDQFKLIDPKLIANHDYGFIGPLVEHEGIIWIGTEGGGLAKYNPKTGEYGYFDLYNPERTVLNSNTVKALCIDRNNLLWIGTYAGGVQTFDMNRNHFSNYYNSFAGINNNIVNDIMEDSKGNIWVGSNTVEGVHIKEHDRNHFMVGFEIQVDSLRVDLPWIRTICETDTNEMWFGSIYYGIFIYRDSTATRHLSTDNSALSSDYISVIIKDSNGIIWIGTYGGGINLYDPATDHIRVYTMEDGLLNDNICSIIQDKYGTIWIGTVAGVSRFNAVDGTFTNFSYNKSSFPIEILNLKSGILASDGQIYFGGNNGIVRFDPKNIVSNQYIPPVTITRLLLNNREISINDGTGILNTSVTEADGITLRYNQTNNITIEFAALNYILSDNNLYMFYLEGYEKGWNEAGFQRRVNYTNLPSGKYALKVKAGNNSGIWNEDVLTFHIHVMPPPWKTWWAYTLYFLLFTGFIYAVIYYFLSRIKWENDIRVKQIEKQTMEQAHQMRLNMFTNFSHELRTPLTLILNPVKNLLSEVSLPPGCKDSLQMIYKNANRMLMLVNQLLDLRKQEAGKMQTKVSEEDLVKFVREIMIIFRELANLKHINIELHTSQEQITGWFDPFLMEKVFYNLLSNAIKNTPDGGTISINIQTVKPADMIELTVCDTGKGIPEEDIENIFAPFFRVNEHNMPEIYGTGLGLHITKSIIQQHHGSIRAENVPTGGACFRIVLPVNKDLFKEEEICTSSPVYSFDVAVMDGPADKNVTEQSGLNLKNAPVILIVDDNADIRRFMNIQLRKHYKVYEAENGGSAWELVEKIIPDIVISDIMMPVMNGLELCTRIKEHVKTSHIPVILLTARTSILQIEEGLTTGADDYITKPFDAELLKIRIRNIIENRRKVKQAYLKSLTVETSASSMGNPNDLFLRRAYDYVKQNMSDADLSIDSFGSELCLSRTQLYRKIKALTGMSPSLFVSTLRLKYAAELLTRSSLSVSEIAYQAGFGNPSYFTTSFKKLYNVTPSEYLQRNRRI